MSEKAGMDHYDAKHGVDEVKHGDRALQIIGDERVTLTDEDVRVSSELWNRSMLKLHL